MAKENNKMFDKDKIKPKIFMGIGILVLCGGMVGGIKSIIIDKSSDLDVWLFWAGCILIGLVITQVTILWYQVFGENRDR
jgi:hypothetical protein